jgi:hypothetical protein
MTGIQTNFTAADMLGGKKTVKRAAPAVQKPAFFAPPAVEITPEPVVEQDEISEDKE